jgi:hypothetical protein
VFTLEQIFNYIATQISCCEEGLVSALICPYCHAINEKGNHLCCDMFAKSARAIIALQSTHAAAADATSRARHKLDVQCFVSIAVTLRNSLDRPAAGQLKLGMRSSRG